MLPRNTILLLINNEIRQRERPYRSQPNTRARELEEAHRKSYVQALEDVKKLLDPNAVINERGYFEILKEGNDGKEELQTDDGTEIDT